MSSLFVYSNNKNLTSYKFDTDGNIIETTEIIKNVSLCSFDICKYFLVYTLWDSNDLFIYSLNTKEINSIEIPEEYLDFTKISSIQIFKHDSLLYIFIALSSGKLIYFQMKKLSKDYDKLYTFSSKDFIFKRKYNLNVEDFTIKKIKQKNNNSLFVNTQTPLFINFNKENLVISYFNIKSCKNLVEIFDSQFLFIFKDKISFGTLLNIQSQNIISKFYGKQINAIKLISFGEMNNQGEKNKNKDYILTIEENKAGNIFRNSFVLNDINLNEISRYNFELDNEQSYSFCEITFKHSKSIESKLLLIGTSIIENISKESTKGHLYLIEINQNNNYKMKKICEIETNGGIHKVITCENIIYICIGNILYIYKIKQLFDNSYEIKQIKKCSDFILINDIELLNESKYKNEINKFENNNINITNSEQYIVISDIGKSIRVFCFSLENNSFTELYREYSNNWVYNFIQLTHDSFYITDIEGNIISLKKNIKKGENDPLRLERIAYYNFGERINSMILTKIKNKDLYTISPRNDDYDINESDEVNIIFFATLEGTLGQIIQINKEIYMFLETLVDLLIKKRENIGGFSYKKWKNYRYGQIMKDAKGFIEGDLIENFLNNDEIYKKQVLKDLNYNWNKQYDEIIHILEILVNNH